MRRFAYLAMLTLWLCTAIPAHATGLDFTLHKLGSGTGPTVLVVGGIQGDEPGGFSAASLLATHYTVTSGKVWVVPNLNFPSIILRSRGPKGDMNRKFASLDPADPEYTTVKRIQDIILNPDVDLILNLHDGSGFYRPKTESPQRNPNRWGQSVIIDQETLEGASRFSQLEVMAAKAVRETNDALVKPDHSYHLKNTHTARGDREMEKTLTWFAYKHKKPAFGIEASKDFTTEFRAYYHLRVVESFLRQAGVKFKRDFQLTPPGVLAALQSNVTVAFADNRVVLPLDDARPNIGALPLPRDAMRSVSASKPILAVVPDKGCLNVHYGNRTVTRISPDWRDADNSLSGITLQVDGKPRKVRFGEVVQVRDSFEVVPMSGYRVNAIGANVGGNDESGKRISSRDFQARYSLDKAGTLYRVETYRDQKFAGMVLVRFGNAKVKPSRDKLPAVAGKESDLGF